MATVPSPRTWTVGEQLTASKLNTDLRDGINFLLAPPLASIYRGSGQTIGNGSLTPVQFTSEDIDRDGGHDNSTNNTRYTAQTAGRYELVAMNNFAGNATGDRQTWLQINGSSSSILGRASTSAAGTQVTGHIAAATVLMQVGDYVEVMVFQSSGGDLLVSSTLARTRLDARWVST